MVFISQFWSLLTNQLTLIPYTGTVDHTIDVGPGVFFFGGGGQLFFAWIFSICHPIQHWLVFPEILLARPNFQTFGESIGLSPCPKGSYALG